MHAEGQMTIYVPSVRAGAELTQVMASNYIGRTFAGLLVFPDGTLLWSEYDLNQIRRYDPSASPQVHALSSRYFNNTALFVSCPAG